MLDKVADSVFITQSCTIQANRGWIANYATISYWCSKPDLNRHALRQKFLRLSWLPISPFEHITHLCIPTSAASQGFVTIQNSKKYLISPGYKKPANPFIRTKGFDKTTTSSCLFFSVEQAQLSPPTKTAFLVTSGKKGRILILQTGFTTYIPH